MSTLDLPWLTPETFPSNQRFSQILKATVEQYRQHGWSLTKPLIAPVLKITLGTYACIILNYLFINNLAESAMGMWTGQSASFFVLGMLVITAITMWPFLTGFWEYIVYFASLNRNAAEAFANCPIQTKIAYDAVIQNNSAAYQILLAAYIILPGLPPIFLTLIFWILLLALGNIAGATYAAFYIGVFLVGSLGPLIYLVFAVLFTFVFQSAVFEKLPLNPIPVLRQSIRMVISKWPTVLGLQFILWILTTAILPIFISLFFRLIGLSKLLDHAHVWVMDLILEGLPTQDSDSSRWLQILGSEELLQNTLRLFQAVGANTHIFASIFTDLLINSLITALLLPLGALAFTRLYWDIRFQIQAKNRQISTST